jgi:hypothetical protein
VRKLLWLFVLAASVLGIAGAPPASALPANPWTGRWLIPRAQLPCNDRPALGITGDQVFTATQTGSRVTFTYTYPGGQSGTIIGNVSPDGATVTAGAAPDGWTETAPSYCFGTGHAVIQLQMAPDGGSFMTVAGAASQTDLGNPVAISGTYQGGGTEPRATPSAITRPLCPGGPWSGLWQGPRSVFTVVQSGSTLTETTNRGETGRATITGNTATGTFNLPGDPGTGTFVETLAPDGLSFSSTGTTTSGAPDKPLTATFIGCSTGTTAPAPNLQTTIPNPQTLTNGPTTIVAPGTISLRSLRRSKCVLVRVGSRQPARVLVSIFSGRRSIRLFGQRLVVFTAPANRQVCIPVPFRARTFNVRTPLRVALGYTAGARRQTSGRKPPPVIRPISLVP